MHDSVDASVNEIFFVVIMAYFLLKYNVACKGGVLKYKFLDNFFANL